MSGMPPKRSRFWTNPSVIAFAGDRDPMEAVIERARTVALEAMENGWSGPPFNPFELATRLGVSVVAHEDIADARLIAGTGEEPVLEYNPSRPRGRLRFSIAHELAHTFFPDFRETDRYRGVTAAIPDAWQLEMLCDVAAAELLMPVGSFSELEAAPLQIEQLMELRRHFEVSVEALLLRVVKLTSSATAVVALSRTDGNSSESALRVDYVAPSRAGWSGGARRGVLLPASAAPGDCTAVGFTAKGTIRLDKADVRIECAGIPPYPGERLPRVVGLLLPSGQVGGGPEMEEVYGDATVPRGPGVRIIAHLVNDRTPHWGGAFAGALKKTYPETQRGFRNWIAEDRSRLRLGHVHWSSIRKDLLVATMVAQHGYGPSDVPRVRYATLRECLITVSEAARDRGASVHMPRIGTGGGGGDWRIIRELIQDTLVGQGVAVTIYAPPETIVSPPPQEMLPL